jgi:hypothetical protein
MDEAFPPTRSYVGDSAARAIEEGRPVEEIISGYRPSEFPDGTPAIEIQMLPEHWWRLKEVLRETKDGVGWAEVIEQAINGCGEFTDGRQ